MPPRMQTKTEYLLNVLAEECAEVIQRISKVQRFGADEIQPGQDATNRTRLRLEFLDLLTTAEKLRIECGFELFNSKSNADIEHMRRKNAKLDTYMTYSRSLGILE